MPTSRRTMTGTIACMRTSPLTSGGRLISTTTTQRSARTMIRRLALAVVTHASCPTRLSSASITPTSTRLIHANSLTERKKLAPRGTCVLSCIKSKSREMYLIATNSSYLIAWGLMYPCNSGNTTSTWSCRCLRSLRPRGNSSWGLNRFQMA